MPREWALPYVSAQEDIPPQGAAAAKKAAAKKRVTTAQLADQVSALATVLPELMEQMKQLSARQDRVEREPPPARESAALPPQQQPFAVAGDASGSPALGSLARSLPPPGRTAAAPKQAPPSAAPLEELAVASPHDQAFFLSMLQNAHRKMFPDLPMPASVEEVRDQGRLSLVSYLERFGGYAHCGPGAAAPGLRGMPLPRATREEHKSIWHWPG